MPIFRTTDNIFKDNGEYFDPNWLDSDKLVLPPRQEWDYKREMQIEDVDLWEVILEISGFGVYASWQPYAEFYLLKKPNDLYTETFYGKKSQSRLYQTLKKEGINLPLHNTWVDSDKLWLYTDE